MGRNLLPMPSVGLLLAVLTCPWANSSWKPYLSASPAALLRAWQVRGSTALPSVLAGLEGLSSEGTELQVRVAVLVAPAVVESWVSPGPELGLLCAESDFSTREVL